MGTVASTSCQRKDFKKGQKTGGKTAKTGGAMKDWRQELDNYSVNYVEVTAVVSHWKERSPKRRMVEKKVGDTPYAWLFA